jgi:hypothetical protein
MIDKRNISQAQTEASHMIPCTIMAKRRDPAVTSWTVDESATVLIF